MTQVQKPFSITPIYDILIRGSEDIPIGLYHLHLATAEQLCRLHYSPGSIKAIKARLKALVDERYIQHSAIPTRLFKSPYYYTLNQKGVHYLEQAGLDISDSFRASKEVNKHSLFVEHTLELNDVLIAAALLHRSAPTYYLHSFIHERALKRSPYKATWRTGGRSESFTVIPDAFLDFRSPLPDGKYRRMPILLEHDRGSEEQHFFRKRIRAYLVLLKSEAYKDLFAAKAITIAFTTFAGTKRLEQMREWTRQELAATNELKAIGLMFYFTNQTRPLDSCQLWLQPCWYTPYREENQPVALLAE